MAAAVQPINLVDYTGGLNLRANEFQLKDNESPDLLNVEVDPAGGLYSRKGWERWNTSNITADTWSPRTAFIHELAAGTDIILVTNNNKINRSTTGSFTVLETGLATPLVASASPHDASFAGWGDTCYIGCGSGTQAAKLVGNATYATLLTVYDAGSANNDYLAPTGGVFPKANFVAAHGGRMWAAGTVEQDGVSYPNRVRWSHPNQPEDWAVDDKIDINEGGGPISAIVPFADHLLVFKQSSIWAIYGYDGSDQQLVNVSRSLGAQSPQVIARNESSVYFVSWPEGVHMVQGGKVEEVSQSLRPAFTSTDWSATAVDEMWLGWMGKRLWFAAPYWQDGVAATARSVFVLDPSIGAWTLFRGASGYGLGPFAQGGYGQGSYDLYGVCRDTPDIVRVDQRESASDVLSSATAVPFPTSYTTRWLHAGWPERKKRWRRPSLIVRTAVVDYTLKCFVYADYEETIVKRIFDVLVDSATGAVLYDDGELYDSGTEYSKAAEGSIIARGGAIGSARAIQIRIDGELGKAWSVNGIVAKYRMRRFT